MEAASDNPQRGRGRPPVFTEDEYARIEAYGLFDEVYTQRGRQDVLYRHIALTQITKQVAEYPQLKWLCDPEKMQAGGARSSGWRPSILTELGRVWRHHDEELFWTLAFAVARDQPTTKDAIEWIRAVKAEQV